jgi:methenyltetrahydrofolate cyclohydrolase
MSEPDYLDLPLRTFLGLLAQDKPGPAGGAAAALGVAMAASLCALTARRSSRQLPDAARLAAEAGQLADLAARQAHADADAHRAVLAARRRKDEGLADALSEAANAPLWVAEVGARVVRLATRLAADGNPNLHGDAVTAALLAEAGARSACALIRINLSGAGSDPRLAIAERLLAALDGQPRISP